MPTATTTTLSGILKEVYAPRVESQIQNDVVALKRIESTSEGLESGGKYLQFPVRLSRNSGVGARLELEALPIAGFQATDVARIPLKFDYGSIRITGQAMQLARTETQSFINTLDLEMDGLVEDLTKNTARQVYGDGTGLLTAFNTGGAAANTFQVVNYNYLNEGDQIDILTIATGAPLATLRTITSIVPVPQSNLANVTFDGAAVAVVALTTGIYRAGNFTGGVIREILGFNRMVNNSGPAYQGLDPLVPGKGRWQSPVFSAGGVNRALSEGLMIQMCDEVKKASGTVPTVVFTSLGVRRSYFNLLSQQRRYNDTKEFAGGHTGLAFNFGTEIPVVADVDCSPNTMYMINETKIKQVQNTPWQWIDEQGEILQKLPNFDIFQAEMRRFWELATVQRNAHGVIRDIIEA
jgi:hypothetical protein